MGQQTKFLKASEETQKGFASYISLNLFWDTKLLLQVMWVLIQYLKTSYETQKYKSY